MLAGVLLAAAVLTADERNHHLKQAVDLFLPTVRTCGPTLLSRYKLKSQDKSLKYSYLPKDRDGIVAAVNRNGDTIILLPRFFRMTPAEGVPYLIHEWLHTQGLLEVDRITETVIQVCGLKK